MMPVAILAGGLGTRLGDLTANTPKALVRVDGVPFIWHQLALLRAAGIGKVFVLASHFIDQIMLELEHASSETFQVSVIADNPPLAGTASALRSLSVELNAPFFVLYGDSYLNCDYQMVEERFRSSGALSLMVVCQTPTTARSNALFDKGMVRRYSKRLPTHAMRHIDYGLSVITPVALHHYRWMRDLSSVQESLSIIGQLAGFEWPERYYSIGTPEGLALTESVIRSRTAHANR